MDAPLTIAIVTAVGSVLGPVVSALLGLYLTRLKSELHETKAAVAEVHVAVNSERTKMLEDVKRLLAENKILAEANRKQARAARNRRKITGPAQPRPRRRGPS